MRLLCLALTLATTRAFHVVPLRHGIRRCSTFRMGVEYDKTKEGDYPHPHDKDYKFGDITKRIIRDMTGNKDYEFGDASKAVATATSDAAEKAATAVIDAGGSAAEASAAAAAVLADAADTTVDAGAAFKNALDKRYGGEYQFGDISKEAASKAVGGIEEAVRSATGNEEYKFGDLSKKLAKGFLGKLSEAAGDAKKKLDDDGK